MTEQLKTPTVWSRSTSAPPSEGHGWWVFAGVLFLFAAVVNVVWGISAISKDDLFRADELLFGDLSAWGVVYLCLAALQGITGILILRLSATGAVLGIVLAGLHATVSLFSIGAYPLWSVTAMVIDGLIIYGLAAHAVDIDD
jgi:hypothetical protein